MTHASTGSKAFGGAFRSRPLAHHFSSTEDLLRQHPVSCITQNLFCLAGTLDSSILDFWHAALGLHIIRSDGRQYCIVTMQLLKTQNWISSRRSSHLSPPSRLTLSNLTKSILNESNENSEDIFDVLQSMISREIVVSFRFRQAGRPTGSPIVRPLPLPISCTVLVDLAMSVRGSHSSPVHCISALALIGAALTHDQASWQDDVDRCVSIRALPRICSCRGSF